ncbi:PTS system beta-glucosides-specific IIC component [Propionicimonas paludicola]|uniref:PTS system beta-glucosides-specific IIC component n=1 Tax=Propionicimonas paludicola TaxID=185243 RepID=A0A2A9CPD1_9ACTN|nr:glucose PTS transporter subunit IIA [Propionicimonas paludicola]PFG16253.1 PTS system beta-glucosides-specific IIC component [Propionicimonas paludicola]
MASETTTLAQEIAAQVGGSDNVTWVGSCTTRLRFVVKNESKVNLAELGKIPGVLQAIKAGGQIQVVIGTHVDQVRDQVLGLPGWSRLAEAGSSSGAAKASPLDRVFDFLGATFQPLLAPITGAALVQVLALLLTQFGVLAPTDPTYLVLSAAGNAVFYFLPIFVGFTATRKLGANPYLGATIAAALLHPSFAGIGETGTVAQAFGLPLFMYGYANTMFPSILIALALAGLDRGLKRWMPKALQQVFNPTLELLILVPLTVLVFGPIGSVVANSIASGTSWLSTTAPFVFYLVVPAVWVLLVSLGIHWAIITIGLVEMANGGSVILGAGAGYQYAMMGIALGMLIKAAREKNQPLRDTAAAASLSVVIGGITEPTLYGLVLRYRRLLVIEVISAAASGLVLSLFHTVMTGFSPAPILALPLFVPMIGAVLGLVTGVTVAVLLIQFWGYEKPGSTSSFDEVEATAPRGVAGFGGVADATASTVPVTVTSPLAGVVRPLEKTGDPVFAGGLIGPGVSIVPSSDQVVAPANGTIVAAPSTAHAIGLRTDTGIDLLIHVGIETVRLDGAAFTLLVEQGQRVTAGQALLKFDAAAITAAGCSVVSPVVVTNLAKSQQLTVLADGPIEAGSPLFIVGPKAD